MALSNSSYIDSAGNQTNLDKAVVEKLVSQVLGNYAPGADKSYARAMAENLARNGLTDIKQLGIEQITVPVVDPDTGATLWTTTVPGGYINKETGKPLTWREGNNIPGGFGETGLRYDATGMGGVNDPGHYTNFNVEFDNKGNPVFSPGRQGGYGGGGLFGGGFLGDLVGGVSDAVGGALGAVGDVANWALENPLQAAALGAGAYYGLPALAGAGETAGGLSALDAGMGAYPSLGTIGAGTTAAATGAGLSALDAGLGAYPTTGAIGAGTAATGGGLLTGAGSSPSAFLGLDQETADLVGLGGSTPAANTGVFGAGSDLNKMIGLEGTTTGLNNLFSTGNLISGGLSTVGGLLQGNTAQNAQQNAAAQYAALADKVSAMGKFSPVGTTTRFGTSNFTVDPKTGQITGFGYTPSAEMLGYQNRLSALAGQGLTDTEQSRGLYAPLQGGAQQAFGLGQSYLKSQLGTPITSLGQQYLGMSPEQAAQDWMNKQQAVLAASRENQLANVRSNLAQTGRTGLSVAQGGALGASNPELQAYYNALAQQDLGLAARATEQGRAQQRFGADLYNTGQNLTMTGQKFGAGLFGTGADLLGGYYSGVNTALNPYTTSMKGVSSLEEAAQQPLSLSTDLANLVAKSGAAQGANYAKIMNPSIESSTIAAQYNPLATIAGGVGSNLLAGYGLAKLFS